MNKLEMITRWFINKLQPDPLKLQKLLYFAQGISFCMYDKELFEENFEGWVHGPAIRSVYQKYSNFGCNGIDIKYEYPELDEEVLSVLEYVKNNYGKYDGKYLENVTHQQTPWLYAREGLDPDARADKTIPKELIAEYFISSMYQPRSEEWEKNE